MRRVLLAALLVLAFGCQAASIGSAGQIGAAAAETRPVSAKSVAPAPVTEINPGSVRSESGRPQGALAGQAAHRSRMADVARKCLPASVVLSGPAGPPTGSGVIIHETGYILTCNRVAPDGGFATLYRAPVPPPNPAAQQAKPASPPAAAPEKRYAYQVVARMPQIDVALLKINADEPLAALPPGWSDDLMLGESVIVISVPHAVSAGLISGVDRAGGTQTVRRTVLGISIEQQAPGDAGVLIGNIDAGSGAQKAGMQKGDLILKIDDVAVAGPEQLIKIVSAKKPGDKVELTLRRGGREIEAEVVLSVREESVGGNPRRGLVATDAPAGNGSIGGPVINAAGRLIGIIKTPIVVGVGKGSPFNAGTYLVPIDMIRQAVPAALSEKRYGVTLGLTVDPMGEAKITAVTAGSPAELAGLRAGDVLTRIGKVAIGDSIDYGLALPGCKAGEAIPVEFLRGGDPHSTTVTPGSAPK